MVRRQLLRRLVDRHRLENGCGRMLVVEQRGVGGEAFDTHELLGVQGAVRLAELGVTFARNLTDSAVMRHALTLEYRHPDVNEITEVRPVDVAGAEPRAPGHQRTDGKGDSMPDRRHLTV